MQSVRLGSPHVSEVTTAAGEMVRNTALEVSALWWTWLLRALVWGILGIVFVFSEDEVGIKTLAILLGVWFLLDGVSSIIGGLFADGISVSRRLLLVILGVLGVAAGVLVMAWPDITAITLTLIAGLFALMWGSLLLFSAVFDDSHLLPRWLQLVLGIAGIAFGLYFILDAPNRVSDLLTIIGTFSLIGAALYLLGALQLRSFHQKLKATARK